MGASGTKDSTESIQLLLLQREYQRAIAACQAALNQRESASVRLMMGKALVALRRFEDARRVLLPLEARAPEMSELQRLLGETWLRSGKSEAAERALRRAIALDPADSAAHELLHDLELEDSNSAPTAQRWLGEGHTVEQSLEEDRVDGHSPPTQELSLTEAIALPRAGSESMSKPPPPPKGISASPAAPRERIDDDSDASGSDARTSQIQIEATTNTLARGPEYRDEDLTELAQRAFDGPEEQGVGEQHPPSSGATLLREPSPEIDRARWPDLPRSPSFPTERGHASPEIPDRQPVVWNPNPVADAPSWAPPQPNRASPVPHGVGWVPGSTDAGWSHKEPGESHGWTRQEPEPAKPDLTPGTRDALGSTARAGRPARRLRWWRPLLVGVLVLALGTGFAGAAYRIFMHRNESSSIHAAELEANADGRLASLRRALAMVPSGENSAPEARALRARLLAVMSLEHGVDRSEEAGALLLGPEVLELPNGRIAQSLLHVLRGENAQALGALSGLVAQGEELAEAYRARALAAYFAGRIPDAEDAAREALHIHPGTPRYASLEAWLRFRAGDIASATAVLDTAIDAAQSPAIRLTRARIADASGDHAMALSEAEAVLGPLAERATSPELGWAHVVRARSRLALGQNDLGADLSEAKAHLNRFDSEYRVAVAQLSIATGQAAEARQILEATADGLIERSRYAALLAEAALDMEDYQAAEAALRASGPGTDAVLLRARLADAQGDTEQAVDRYLQAATDPRLASRARTRAATILLDADRADEAEQVLQPLLGSTVRDTDTVAFFVRVALRAGDAPAARRALEPAIEADPSRDDLYALRAASALADGDPEAALGDIQKVLASETPDPEILSDLGNAAYELGQLELAERIAARLGEGPEAGLLRARIALGAGRLEDAGSVIETLPPGRERARLSAELHVALGHGASAADEVRALAQTHADARVHVALGRLYEQAEDDSAARSAYERALRIDPDTIGAIAGLAALQIRRGGIAAAARGIERAEQLAERSGAGAGMRARIETISARLAFERGDFEEAVRAARAALQHEPRNGEAHAVLAIVDTERGRDPTESLRAAASGVAPPAEAIAQLALRSRGDEQCELARRYRQEAPRGYDRPALDRSVRGCR